MKKQRKALFNLPGLEKQETVSYMNENMSISEILETFCTKHYGQQAHIVKAHILKYLGDFRQRHNRNLGKKELINDLETIIKGMTVEEVMSTVATYGSYKNAQGVQAYKWFKNESKHKGPATKDKCDELNLNLESNEEKRKKLRRLCDIGVGSDGLL